MKRFVAIFAVIAMLCTFCSVSVLAAEDTMTVLHDGKEMVVPVEDVDVKQQPTCEEDGWGWYKTTASDGNEDNYEVIIPATGHVEAIEVVKEPTCTEEGLQNVYCVTERTKDNPAILRQETIPASNHNWVKTTTEATCSAKGKIEYVCSMCGAVATKAQVAAINGETYRGPDADKPYSEEIPVDVSAHNWGDWQIDEEPTCCDEGTEIRTCKDCGQTEIRSVDATGKHDLAVDKVVRTDCTHITITYKCTTKGCTETKEEVREGNFHQLVEETEKYEAPTCTKTGTKYYKCAICGEEITETVDKLNHDWGEWSTKQYTQTNAQTGEKTTYYVCTCQCKNCGAILRVTVDNLEDLKDPQAYVQPADGPNTPEKPSEPTTPTQPTEPTTPDNPDEPVIKNVYAAVGGITVDGRTASGTVTFAKVAGNQEDAKLYARIAYLYENEDGLQVLTIATQAIDSEMTVDVYGLAPVGYTVKSVCVVATTERVTAGNWAMVAVSQPVVA